jgi:hypothetical protein
MAMAAAALGIGALSALPTSMQAGAASPASAAKRMGQAPHVAAGAANLGALPATTALHADVELSPRDPAGLSSYATAVSTPGNALYKQYITPSQFTNRFGPTPAAVSAVEKQLAASGLTVGKISTNNLTLPVTGSASTFGNAFSTGFTRYRLADQRIAYDNTAAPLIPGTIAGYVQGVIGLDDLTQPEAVGLEPAEAPRSTTASPHVVTGGPQPCASAVTDGTTFNALTADQVASAYSLSSLYEANDEGAGDTVGLLELEPNSTNDIATFQTCYGTSAPVTYTEVDGGSGTGPGEGEAALDIEGIIDLAPKAAIDVFQAPNTFPALVDDYTSMVDDSRVNVISTSWGDCEAEEDPTVISAEGTLFQQSATEGQSVYAASGDAGSSGCGDSGLEVDDPGSQPFVTSVGGTTLRSIAGPVQTVWNDSFEGGKRGAGGGGISELHAMPAYQSGAPAALNVVNASSSGSQCGAATGLCREVPDVSASADEDHGGYVVFYDGDWTAFGGTSAAAPTWAAFTALTNASSTCQGIGVGFANPALYDAAAANYSANFDDITSGNNDYTADGYTGGLYPSGPAYDMASGLGTMNGGPLAAKLCGSSTPVPPTVTKVAPSSGPVAGGTTVTITGTGLTGVTGVKFGTNPATNVTVVSDTSITAVSPAGTAGVSDVTVSAPSGTSNPVATDHFTYASGARPAVTGVSPTSGPATGGTTVIITGVNFTGATKVTFASVAAPSFTVTAPSSITAVSPPGAVGARNVQVTTAGGTSPGVAGDLFTYTTSRPTITGISPASGPTTGGTKVTITGTGFTGVTQVTFAGVAATSFTVVSATKLTAVSPAGAAGARVIQVTTPSGTSPGSSADLFTYIPPRPTVTAVSPTSGPTTGGTKVTVTGTSFTGATEVTFAGVAATSFTVVSATKLTAVSPAGAAGARNIQVTTPSGTSPGVAGDLFTYTASRPAITAVSPASGPKSGGTSVILTGTGFTGATEVTFAGVAAPSFTVVSATEIATVSPAGAVGVRNVQVATPSGTSPGSSADFFTYTSS